jgi:hypothetical protein
MHECYFSLNIKCKNTYFTLIEQQSIHRDIYQGEASPLKGSSHPWVRWCVSILSPSTSIYSAKTSS